MSDISSLVKRIEALETEVKTLKLVSRIEHAKDEKALSKFKKSELETFIKHFEIKPSSDKKIMVNEIWDFLCESDSESSESDSE
jgi:hypothetical protein